MFGSSYFGRSYFGGSYFGASEPPANGPLIWGRLHDFPDCVALLAGAPDSAQQVHSPPDTRAIVSHLPPS